MAVDGEVVLAAVGDSVGDASVVSVDDESVRLRLVDGTESTLVSP
jgi:sRNA-binding protein